jgi:hypothetical protein
LADLAKPSVRTARPAKQAAILDVARSGPGSLLRDSNRVLVDVRFGSGASAGVDDLRAAGGEVVHVSRRYQTVTVAVPPAALRDVADVARVEGVTENLAPLIFAAGDSSPVTSDAPPPCGAATSEGDTQLNAMAARDAFSVDGTGVTVGVLSDSYDRDASADTDASQDVASGDLPGPGSPCGHTDPVSVLDDSEVDGADEGRAMAQIVHDLAPGAKIAFATAFTSSMFGFADNIRLLAEPVASGGADAKVIVDDVIWFDEPFFQDGPVAVAVNDVTDSGVAYFSSAGNNNLIDGGGRDVASWEGSSFRDAACPAALEAVLGAEHCMDFDPGAGTDPTFEITVSAGATLTVDLQWNEPWNGVTADIDAFLLDSSDNPIEVSGFFVGSADDNVGVTQRPVEVFQWENTTGSSQKVRLAINRCFGLCNPAANPLATPRLKFALLQNGGGVTSTEYSQSLGGDVVGPTIFGHNGAANAMSVGAIRYNTNSAPESFSSRGPVVHYFGPATGNSPAPELPGAQVLSKPDLVATDGGENTFFGTLTSEPKWRFFGTSASAPHAAAIAALEVEAASDPTIDPAVIKQAQIETADPVGGFDSCAVGAGIVNALDAVGEVVTPGSGSGPAPCVQPFSGPIPAPVPPLPSAAQASSTAVSDKEASTPQTRFALRPARLVRTFVRWAWVRFLFGANESDVTFLCKVDRGRFHSCPALFARWFSVGRHIVRVKARDAAGNVDPTPAVYRFRVKRIR